MLCKAATVQKNLSDLLNKGLHFLSDFKDKIAEYVKNSGTFPSLGSSQGESYTKKVIFDPEQNYSRPATSTGTL